MTFFYKNFNISLVFNIKTFKGDIFINLFGTKRVCKTLSILLFFLICFSGYAQENAHISSETQQWNDPLERADLLLFSSHADDEHLFFAGILPYCIANGIKAQVVYMTNHNDNPIRNTELLNGLWAVGITNSPVISPFPDLFSESLEEAIRVYKSRGVSEDDFIAFCTENIRRFKPQVAVGHDINGEYSHGTHILSSVALMKAVVLAGDPNYHSESFEKYGIWDTPKTYINLWKERPIVLSINEPLVFFNGKSAFQVSQHGFSYHKSQHWTWFYRWVYGTEQAPITSSTQIRIYTPGRYGLYRTLVGDDSQEAGDFFENTLLIKDIIEEQFEEEQIIDIISIYDEQEKIESEKQYLKFLIPAFIVLAAVLLLLLFLKKKSKRE